MFSYWALGVISGIVATIIIFFKVIYFAKIKTFKIDKYYSIFRKIWIHYFSFPRSLVDEHKANLWNGSRSLSRHLFFIINSDSFPSFFHSRFCKKVLKFLFFFFSKKGWLMLAFYKLSSDNKLDSNVIRTIIASLS